MMAFEQRSFMGNASVVALTTAMAPGDTTMVLSAVTGFTGANRFVAAIDPGQVSFEKVLCQGISGTTVTILQRGYDGTTALSHAIGATVQHVFDGVAAQESHDAARLTLGAVTTKGDLIAGTGSQAVTRVGAGADGSALYADSSQASGLRWGASVASQLVQVYCVFNGTVAADAAITWTTASPNPSALWSAGAPTRITVATTGTYLWQFQYQNGSSTACLVTATPYKNGSTTANARNVTGPGTTNSASETLILALTAGDYLELHHSLNSGTYTAGQSNIASYLMRIS